MSKNRGFTLTEMMIAIIFVLFIGGIFYVFTSGLQASHRDIKRKTAINAIYYNLVEVAKPALGGYPRVITSEQLRAMDSALLTDPDGKKIGDRDSDYIYEPSRCNGGDICQGFTLRAILERENMLTKRSP